MQVKLLHHTPLWVASTAIRKCWASEGKSDTTSQVGIFTTQDGDEYAKSYCTTGDKDKELIERIGNKNKHKSTLEHLVYTFDIDGISRACLQEVARHRLASYSVKSTRYTLKELKNSTYFSDFLVDSNNYSINYHNIKQLETLKEELISDNISNDVAKYMLPEAYKTSLVMTINARSLQNFLELRTSKAALWEIQQLALVMYEELPDEHKYLFEEYVKDV